MNLWTFFKWYWGILGISIATVLGVMIGMGEWEAWPIFLTLLAAFSISMSVDAREREQQVKRK